MKRILSLCLIAALLLSLLGCRQETASENTTDFYYLRASYVYGTEDGVIAPEPRDTSSRGNTLLHLLGLYLQGPLDDQLRSPFPAGCSLESVSLDGSTLCVTLDSSFSSLQGMDLTLACACLAKTCFSLTDVTQVQIQSTSADNEENVNVVLSIDSLLLDDNSGLAQQAATEQSR